MREIEELVDGYKKFLDTRYERHRNLYHELAQRGQKPKNMIIACCDSRVEPAAIFDAGPGMLFIVRNVANLVPPYEPLGDYHGTSAALEFAVKELKVENIVVMGHARCGGVKAYLEGHYSGTDQGEFITKWMSLLRSARGEALNRAADKSPEVRQQLLEKLSIIHSLDNLLTFPFIKSEVDAGALKLHGAYFDIATGRLEALDRASGDFVAVS